VFSDGAGSQFKNRYIYHFLPVLRGLFKIKEVSWNFFASAHGKGPVDGVGGTLKRMAASAITRRTATVANAAEFQRAVQSCDGVRTLLVNDTRTFLNMDLADRLKEAPAVKGIQQDHSWMSSYGDGLKRAPLTRRMTVHDPLSANHHPTSVSPSAAAPHMSSKHPSVSSAPSASALRSASAHSSASDNEHPSVSTAPSTSAPISSIPTTSSRGRGRPRCTAAPTVSKHILGPLAAGDYALATVVVAVK
jgi:hypothetical protein